MSEHSRADYATDEDFSVASALGMTAVQLADAKTAAHRDEMFQVVDAKVAKLRRLNPASFAEYQRTFGLEDKYRDRVSASRSLIIPVVNTEEEELAKAIALSLAMADEQPKRTVNEEETVADIVTSVQELRGAAPRSPVASGSGLQPAVYS